MNTNKMMALLGIMLMMVPVWAGTNLNVKSGVGAGVNGLADLQADAETDLEISLDGSSSVSSEIRTDGSVNSNSGSASGSAGSRITGSAIVGNTISAQADVGAEVNAETDANAEVSGDANIDVEAGIQAGVTPDNILWGIDVAFDRIVLVLTFDTKAKAEKGLEIAAERLAEVQAMIEAKKEVAVQAAVKAHGEFVEETSVAIGALGEADVEASLGSTVELKQKIDTHIQASQTIPASVRASLIAKGATLDEQAEAEASVEAALENIARLRTRIEAKENEIKIEAKARGIDIEDIEAKVNAEIDAKIKARAEARIESAHEAVAKAKANVNATSDSASVTLLANAEAHLSKAEAAFDAGFYGRAFGQATAALNLAENAMSIEAGSEEEIAIGASASEKLKVSVKSNVILSTEVMSTLNQLVNSLKDFEGEVEMELRVHNDDGDVEIDAEVDGSLNANQEELWAALQEQISSIVETEAGAEVEIEIEHELETEGEFEIDVRTSGNASVVVVEQNGIRTEFVLNTTDRAEIAAQIAARMNMSTEEIESELEADAETEMGEDLKVKARVLADSSIIVIEQGHERRKFKIDATEREEIVTKISEKTELDSEDIEAELDIDEDIEKRESAGKISRRKDNSKSIGGISGRIASTVGSGDAKQKKNEKEDKDGND